jgi:hypothetical protein
MTVGRRGFGNMNSDKVFLGKGPSLIRLMLLLFSDRVVIDACLVFLRREKDTTSTVTRQPFGIEGL